MNSQPQATANIRQNHPGTGPRKARWIVFGGVAIALELAGLIGLVQAFAPPTSPAAAAPARPMSAGERGPVGDTSVPDAATVLQNASDEVPTPQAF